MDAEFRSNLVLPGDAHPEAEPNNDDIDVINVAKGSKLSGVPAHKGIISLGYNVLDDWDVRVIVNMASGQYFRGDESNQLRKVGGYAVVSLQSSYTYNDSLTAFLRIDNLLNRDYETFGILGDAEEVIEGADNPRFVSAAPPISVFAGVRYNF